MALIQCDNCGKLISEKAKKCPNCNIQIKKKKIDFKLKNINKKKSIVVLSSFILVIFFGLLYYYKLSVPSIETVKKSVVMIETYDSNGNLLGTGSGFCALKKDLIVTNFHVIEGANKIKIITNNHENYSASKVLIFDYQNDLAILKTDASLSPLKLGNSSTIKTGKKIKTIGSPLGEMNTLSTGIISNADNDSGIQISAPISHGSSGGVLLDNRNRVIGITYAGYDIGQNINFAINVKLLKHLYDKYQKGEYYNISSSTSGKNVNYVLCYPLLGTGDLNFNGCRASGKDKDDLYSIDSINMFYKVTDKYTIYDNTQGSNNSLYNSLTYSEKKLAMELYLEIDDDANVYSSDLNSINIVDLIYAISKAENSTFNKANLANAIAAIKNIENNRQCFNKVNEMKLSVKEKRLLSLGICPLFSPSDLSNTDANGFIEDINSLSLSVTQKSTILRRFGYSVVDGRVTW